MASRTIVAQLLSFSRLRTDFIGAGILFETGRHAPGADCSYVSSGALFYTPLLTGQRSKLIHSLPAGVDKLSVVALTFLRERDRNMLLRSRLRLSRRL